MFSNKKVISTLIVGIIIFFSILTRSYKLDWGDGYFFHPDENNMASALSQLKPSNLNPNFYAYGQFPLYLSYVGMRALNIPNNFDNSVFVLRMLSAIYSVISLYIIYLIILKLFSNTLYSRLYLLLFIFNPGLIQISHFGTTESLLVLIFLSNIYLSFLYLETHRTKFILCSSIISGIGLATKISSLVFVFPILLSIFIVLLHSKHFLKTIAQSFIFILITILLGLVLSPYNIIKFEDFLSSMRYETGVAAGSNLVFYTTQFIKTPAYIFQLIKVFPFISGIPQYLLGLVGLVLVIRLFKTPQKNLKYWTIILSSGFIYFIYFGQLYVKWTRFMSPLFFIFPLLTAYVISKIKSHSYQTLLLIICILPGIYFFLQYFRPDIRVVASNWLIANLPPKSLVLSEGGNIINLPVGDNQLTVDNYDFYKYDATSLAASLNISDYVLIPSRRVFANYHYSYYTHLFNGTLGFTEIKFFTPSTDLLLNPEIAEETWSVFDRPTIRIYKKVSQLSLSQYENLVK